MIEKDKKFLRILRRGLIENLKVVSPIIYLFPKVKGCFWTNKTLVVYGQYLTGEIMLNFIQKDNKIRLRLNEKDYYSLRRILVNSSL